MKKIFFATITFAITLLSTSCSNDEIDIEKVGRKFDLACSINTQGIYDKFGWTNDIRDEYLRDGSRAIGVQTFLYGQDGNLVKSEITVLPTFNTANVKFDKVVEGVYTIVVVETLVNPDVDNKSSDWTFEDVGNLSTLKVKSNGTLGWASILGVVSKNVSVSSNTELNLEPEAIGARIDFYSFNVGNASYVEDGVSKMLSIMGMATTDILDSYNLNPQLSRKDRYIENLTASDKTNVRARMATEKFSSGGYTSFYIVEQEATWRYCWQYEDDAAWYNFDNTNITSAIEDGKTYCAGFYYFDDSHYPATYFGDESGIVSWKRECDDFLNSLSTPASATFAKPYTNWSVGTVTAVKSYMSGFDLFQDVTFNASRGKYEMIYFDNNNYRYDYDFTSASSGLTDSWVFMDGSTTDISTVRNEVEKQGYTYHSQNGNNYYYTSADTYVTVYKTENGTILVNYYDPKAYGLAPRRSESEMERIFQRSSEKRRKSVLINSQLIRKYTCNNLRICIEDTKINLRK